MILSIVYWYCTVVDQIQNVIRENVYHWWKHSIPKMAFLYNMIWEKSFSGQANLYEWHCVVHSSSDTFFFCLIRNVNLLSIVWPQEILLILKENSSIFWQLNDTSCFKIRNCISVHKNSWKKSLKFKVYFAMEMKLKKANVGNKLLKAIKNHYS